MSPVARAVEAVVPARLGRSFRWLFAASIVNNVGDGVVLAAGPLLVAAQTRDAFLVSLALFMQYLPMLLFALIGGVAADRFDRKRMVVVADLARALVLAVLVATIVTGTVSIAVVLAALFLLGTAETFADSASSTLIPNVVPSEDLGIANARMQGAFVLMNQLVFPPVGAFLFVIGPAIPFAANAVCFLLGAVLITRVVVDFRTRRAAATDAADAAPDAGGDGRSSIRRDLAEGIRWLMSHPPMRTLALTVFAFNVTFGAAWAVLVLYADDRLGMDEVGFGLLTTAIAVGGIAGSVSYGRLERRFSLADLMRVGLVIETITHLVLALTTSAAIALVMLAVFGAHAFVWGTTSTVVRQRAVPDEVLGRVGGVYRMAVVGGMVIGTPIGGVLAREFGITAPFWFGFAGSAILVLALWREFEHIGHAGAIRPSEAATTA